MLCVFEGFDDGIPDHIQDSRRRDTRISRAVSRGGTWRDSTKVLVRSPLRGAWQAGVLDVCGDSKSSPGCRRAQMCWMPAATKVGPLSSDRTQKFSEDVYSVRVGPLRRHLPLHTFVAHWRL